MNKLVFLLNNIALDNSLTKSFLRAMLVETVKLAEEAIKDGKREMGNTISKFCSTLGLGEY